MPLIRIFKNLVGTFQNIAVTFEVNQLEPANITFLSPDAFTNSKLLKYLQNMCKIETVEDGAK